MSVAPAEFPVSEEVPLSLLRQLRCHFEMRVYQQHALEVAEQQLQDGGEEGRKWHLVAPPGSGKTILGLELIRRLGEPAVIFSPNAAIQRQWRDKIRHFLPLDGSLTLWDVVAEAHREPPLPILSLTYQSLSVASRDTELLDELAQALWAEEVGDRARLEALYDANRDAYREELQRYRSRVRKQLMEEPDFDPVRLLHPSSRALMGQLVTRGTRTVVLDECHHLTGTWAILLAALVRRLDDPIVIGLTATPPLSRDNVEQLRYLDLVGEIDFQVPTPAVVRDGNLAPYQDLLYLTEPTSDEMAFVARQHEHWNAVQERLNRDGAFHTWLHERLHSTKAEAGRPMEWEEFLKSRRSLAVALVRWHLAQGWEIPAHVHLTSEMILPLDLDDRLRLIGDFALRHLKVASTDEARDLYRELKAAGRSLGYNLTERGFRRTVAPVDRLLSLSRAKQEATLEILRHEWAAMGEQLRAVVITDFEKSSATVLRQLSGVLDPEAESALGMMRLLAASELEETLRPVLVTGRTLLCANVVLEHFMEAGQRWLRQNELLVTLRSEPVEDANFHQIHGSGADWRTGTYVAMVTALLERGVTRCLVGTRALLGEGWDSISLNTFIDLTYATTFASVNQLRGRAIRLDPRWPEKVANNWDVVCIAPAYEKGLQDYERFVRKHSNYYGISDDGIIEAGVGHVHPLLHEVGGHELAAAREAINHEMLGRAKQRERARELWRIGEPYEDRHLLALDATPPPKRPNTLSLLGETQRQRADAESVALINRVLMAFILLLLLTPLVGWLAGATLAGAVGWLGLWGARLLGGLLWLLLAGGAALWTLPRRWERTLQRRLAADGPTALLRAMGTAVLEGLQESDQLPQTVTPDAIRLSSREDGSVRVWLDAEDSEAVERFGRAMSDLLGPVTDEFRYMLSRVELSLPERGGWRYLHFFSWAQGAEVEGEVIWHPVPQALGVRAATVAAFARAWQCHVSPGQTHFLRRAEAVEQLREARRRPLLIERHLKRIWQ